MSIIYLSPSYDICFTFTEDKGRITNYIRKFLENDTEDPDTCQNRQSLIFKGGASFICIFFYLPAA
jgi:hypothetical protein